MAVQSRPQPVPEDRWQTIRDIWHENHWLFAVAGFFAGLLAFPALDTVIHDLTGFLGNLAPEAVGMAFTVFVIERFNQRREERQRQQHEAEQKQEAEKQERERLIRDLRSGVRDIAKRAALEMDERGWLRGDSLAGADLKQVDLRGTILSFANLHNTHLLLADLRGADLGFSNLRGAMLWRADLSSTNLVGANLSGAILMYANLNSAKIEGANLYATRFDEGTILPDGEYWTPEKHEAKWWQQYGAVWLTDEQWNEYSRIWNLPPQES